MAMPAHKPPNEALWNGMTRLSDPRKNQTFMPRGPCMVALYACCTSKRSDLVCKPDDDSLVCCGEIHNDWGQKNCPIIWFQAHETAQGCVVLFRHNSLLPPQRAFLCTKDWRIGGCQESAGHERLEENSSPSHFLTFSKGLISI